MNTIVYGIIDDVFELSRILQLAIRINKGSPKNAKVRNCMYRKYRWKDDAII